MIEGKPLPYDLAALEDMKAYSRYSDRSTERTLCLTFNQEDYAPEVPRVVVKGDTSKTRPAVSNQKRLAEIFDKHGRKQPEIISANVWHGATQLSLDVAAVVDPADDQIIGMGVATSRKDAQNLAVRDAVHVACQKFCAAPA